jgi:hypothetical protein
MRKIVSAGLVISALLLFGYFTYEGLRALTKFYYALSSRQKANMTEVVPFADRSLWHPKLEGSIYIGENWLGQCNGSPWMIRVQESDPKSITVLEGDMNGQPLKTTHKAPGGFVSKCKYIKVIPSGYGEGDWKVNIYSR